MVSCLTLPCPKFHELTSNAGRQPSDMIPSTRQLDNALVSLTARIDNQNGPHRLRVRLHQCRLHCRLHLTHGEMDASFVPASKSGVLSSFLASTHVIKVLSDRAGPLVGLQGVCDWQSLIPRAAATLKDEDSSMSIKS